MLADADCGMVAVSMKQMCKRVENDDSQLIKYDIMTPTATMIWKQPVMRPRTSFGQHSDTNAGATAEMAPIPTPATTRPA